MTTLANKVAWDDTVLPFQLDATDIRGRVARLDGTLDRILGQHAYPAPVQGLVAEAALLTALIGHAIKLRWKLSLQIRGNGPIRLIATDYLAPSKDGEAAAMRAYASFDGDALAGSAARPFDLIGAGVFAVLIDQGPDMTPYQGMTPLAGGSLAQCATTYFAQSEQLPTRFALGAALSAEPGVTPTWRAGGIMLQTLPADRSAASGATGEAALLQDTDVLTAEEAEGWNRTMAHLETVELTELIGPHVDPTTLLRRLFHEESPRVFAASPVHFGCSCGPEKVEQTLSIYSAKDIEQMTTQEGILTADCQFCGAHYEFDPTNLGFEAKKPT